MLILTLTHESRAADTGSIRSSVNWTRLLKWMPRLPSLPMASGLPAWVRPNMPGADAHSGWKIGRAHV